MSDTSPVPLRRRALGSMAWALAGQIGQQAVRLAVTIVLARLLAPNDFGLVSLVGTITGFANVFAEAGVCTALIQRKEIERRHVASAAWLTWVMGLGLAALIAATAPLLVHAFGEQQLRGLALGFALDLVVRAPGLVPAALLARQLRFDTLIRVELTGTLLGGSAAVVHAVLSPGPWPMVTFLLVTDAVTTVLFLVAQHQPVAWLPDPEALGDLWDFGRGLLGDTLFNYWSRNADNVLIGRYLGSAALGVYSRAYVILLLPVQQVASIVNRVMFPAMSSVQDDPPRVRSAYLRTVAVVSIVIFPVAALLAASSRELVLGVLGPPWSAAIPVIRIFAAVTALQSIGTTTGWLYQVTGHTSRMFRVTVVLTVLVIAGFAIGVQFGLMGVAYSYLTWNLVSLTANLFYGGRGLSLSLSSVLSEMAVPLALALGLCGALLGVRELLPSIPALAGLAILTVSAIVFYTGELAMFRPAAWTHLRAALVDVRRPHGQEALTPAPQAGTAT